MAWTNTQKQIAARAAKAAGVTDEQRRLILRQLPNAFYDREGNAVDEPTSTSKRLTNIDMESYMAVVEEYAGGQIKVGGPRGDGFTPGYWRKCAGDRLGRLRRLVSRIAAALEKAGRLEPEGVGLAGWIENHASDDQRTRRLDRLTYSELHRLINQLRDYARRHGVSWETEPTGAATPV